jgi:hypothetical protein
VSEVDQFIEALERLHGVGINPADPVLMQVTLTRLLLKEGREDLARIVSEGADRTSASLAQYEEATRKRTEATLSVAGEWCATQIREAGEAASAALHETIEADLRRADRARVTTVVAAMIGVTAAICAAMPTLLPLLDRLW